MNYHNIIVTNIIDFNWDDHKFSQQGEQNSMKTISIIQSRVERVSATSVICSYCSDRREASNI